MSLSYYQPGDPYTCEFVTLDSITKVRADADVLPTVLASRDGADDPSFVLTVTRTGVGNYVASGSIPTTYATGDHVSIVAKVRSHTVTGSEVIDRFGIISGYNST